VCVSVASAAQPVLIVKSAGAGDDDADDDVEHGVDVAVDAPVSLAHAFVANENQFLRRAMRESHVDVLLRPTAGGVVSHVLAEVRASSPPAMIVLGFNSPVLSALRAAQRECERVCVSVGTHAVTHVRTDGDSIAWPPIVCVHSPLAALARSSGGASAPSLGMPSRLGSVNNNMSSFATPFDSPSRRVSTDHSPARRMSVDNSEGGAGDAGDHDLQRPLSRRRGTLARLSRSADSVPLV
jgi:hypothetical protein